MKSYMKIHCFSCGGDWNICEGSDWKAPGARMCPHCGNKVDRAIWETQVLPAFNLFADANRELEKDSRGYHTPLFNFDCISHK